MLQRNPLNPPRPPVPQVIAPVGTTGTRRPFVSAEDFDVTGLLAGLDPCESRYWWMPELYGPEVDAGGGPIHATRRTPSRSTAAA